MAVLASDQIALVALVDIKSFIRFYKLQNSTLPAPGVPSDFAAPGWSTIEPGYTEGSTDTLYTVERVTFSDDTFKFLDVQVSSSYEAAKIAYNKAVAAIGTAATADGRVTVATAEPTPAQATGKPEGAVWFVKIGPKMDKMFVLTSGAWVATPIGQNFVGEDAIGTAQIADLAVGTAQIGDAAVTNAKIRDITADRLIVGHRNLMPNGALEDGTLSGWSPLYTLVTFDDLTRPAPGITKGFSYNGNTASSNATVTNNGTERWMMLKGQTYLIDFWIKADKPNSRVYFELRDELGALVPTTNLDGTGAFSYVLQSYIVPTVWTRIQKKVVPVRDMHVKVGSMYFNHSTGSEQTATITLTGFLITPPGVGVLIEDGAITAPKIAAKSITAEKMVVAPANLWPDPGMLDEDGWGISGTPAVFSVASWAQSGRVLNLSGSATTYTTWFKDSAMELEAGGSYMLSCKIRFGGSGTIPGSIGVSIKGTTDSGVVETLSAGSIPRTYTGPPNNNFTPGVNRINFDIPNDRSADRYWKSGVTIGFTMPSGASTTASIQISDMSVTRRTSAELIVDGAITAQHVNGEKFEGLDFWSPSATKVNDGVRAHVGDSKFEIIRTDSEGREVPTITMGGASVDQLQLFDTSGNAIAGFDEVGAAVAKSLTLADGDLVVGGIDVMHHILTRLPRGILQSIRYQSGSFPRFNANEVGLFEMGCLMYWDRLYRISGSWTMWCASNTRIMIRLRFNVSAAGDTDPASPTIAPTASTVLRQWYVYLPASQWVTFYAEELYRGQYSAYIGRFVFTAMSDGGNYETQIPVSSTSPVVGLIEDIGLVNGSAQNDGTTTTAGGTASNSVVNVPPTTSKKTYTSVWEAGTSATPTLRSWRGTTVVSDTLQYGSYSGVTRYSLAMFTGGAVSGQTGVTIYNALSGSTGVSLEMWIEPLSWYAGSGGKFYIGRYDSGSDSLPALGSSVTNVAAVATSATYPAGVGRWVPLPSGWATQFALRTARGLTLGQGSGTAHYGKARYAHNAIKIRAQYTK